jgi:RimJ/RimL family protein N-acetyltransferase
MNSAQSHLRLQRQREQYLHHRRLRKFDATLFVPLATPQLWLCVADRKQTCHLTAAAGVNNGESMSGLTISAIKDEKNRDENTITWFIYHKDNPTEQIGSIAFFNFSTLDAKISSATLAYTLSETSRGKGYMSEALGAVLQFGFEKLGLQKIEARVRTTNDRSKAVVQRAGFKSVGNVRKGKWGLEKDIEIVELEVWTLTNKDWEAHLRGAAIDTTPHL